MGLFGRYTVNVFLTDATGVSVEDGASAVRMLEGNRPALTKILGEEGYKSVIKDAELSSLKFTREVVLALNVGTKECLCQLTVESDWDIYDWITHAIDACEMFTKALEVDTGGKCLYMDAEPDGTAAIYYGENVFSECNDEDILCMDGEEAEAEGERVRLSERKKVFSFELSDADFLSGLSLLKEIMDSVFA